MKKPDTKSTRQLLLAASLVASASAWAQGNEPPGDALVKRIDALMQEIQQLKAQVKANEEKTAAEMKALSATAASRPAVAPPAEKSAAGPARDASGEPDGIDLVKTAKASLKLYGMIDVGVEALGGSSLASGADARSVRVSNGMVTPHFGIMGSGELTQGLQASFNLEGSFAPDNGTSGIGGRLFGRQSWVGLSGGFGTLRFGRQYTMVRIGWEDANPYGTGNQGLRLLDPRISNPRADNSISYQGKWGPVSAGINLSNGWDAVNGNSSNTGPANNAGANCPGEVPGASGQCKEWSVGLKYDGRDWGVAAAYEKLHGGTSATFGGLGSPGKTDERAVLGAYLKLKGGTKLAAGWMARDNMGSTTPRSNMYWVQSIVPLGGPWFVDGLLAHLKYDNSPNKASLVNLRGRYVLTKEASLYATLAYMDNGGALALPATASTPLPTPAAGGNQTSLIAGVLYRF